MIETSKNGMTWKSSSAPTIITKDDCEYATFLKDLERICSKTGYLDSQFYTKNAESKTPLSNRGRNETHTTIHSFDIARNREQFMDDYEKKMKRINMSLLQEKRRERILKRNEGDIIKRQHLVTQSLRDFATEVNDKKLQQDRKLNETAENLEKIRKRHYFEKSQQTKERMRDAVNYQTEKLGKSRKVNLNVSKLLREFNSKRTELDSTSIGISRLMEDFENHLSQEENKHKRLQKELESISEALKLEMMKSQTQKQEIERDSMKQLDQKKTEDKLKEQSLSKFLNQSDDGIKNSEMERKVLDAKLAMKTEEHSVKRKENSGAMNTIRNKLAECENSQRRLIDDTNYINLLLRRADNQNKIESAALRRTSQMESTTNDLIKARQSNEIKYNEQMYQQQILMDLANETDNLTHLKCVIKNDKENEQKIFKKMNDASKEIKQESVIVNRLSKELHDLHVKNASKLNDDLREANKREQQMEEELNRQRTKLLELQTQRNNYFNDLVSCRKYLQENKNQLERSEVQTSRLAAIKERGDGTRINLPLIA